MYSCTPVLQLVDVQQHSGTLMTVAEQYDSVRTQDGQAPTGNLLGTAAAEVLPSHCRTSIHGNTTLHMLHSDTAGNNYTVQVSMAT